MGSDYETDLYFVIAKLSGALELEGGVLRLKVFLDFVHLVVRTSGLMMRQ